MAESDFETLKQIVLGCGKVPAEPRYFHSKSIGQVAAVTDVCAIRDSSGWLVTAEVEKTTRGNELIDNLWKYPVETTASSRSGSEARDVAIVEMFTNNFPDADWDEVDQEQYAKLRAEYGTPYR